MSANNACSLLFETAAAGSRRYGAVNSFTTGRGGTGIKHHQSCKGANFMRYRMNKENCA